MVEGKLVEERLAIGSAPRATRPTGWARRSTSTPRTCTGCTRPGPAASVSIHAYSPPLWRMGSYNARARRHAATHVDLLRQELRPALGRIAEKGFSNP